MLSSSEYGTLKGAPTDHQPFSAPGDHGDQFGLLVLVEHHILVHELPILEGEHGLSRQPYLLDGLSDASLSFKLPRLIAVGDLRTRRFH